ncbi:hypothetical protein D9Q98_007899 [Chlorella vulgaris]|uniref:CDP-Ethanolamine:DAG ethanolamine phosphotransferase n=1 Tax=Chlorella vulgaris TaxID=3077 RepID=A0A9D4YU43_CHLVU|nr:hypothetical protein D9Q98_007899 [Chlorella vulgaris]
MEAPYQGTRSHDPPAASAMKLGPTYLTTRALSGLAHYAYKPSGYTVLDRLHQPFWNYITDNWLPMWLAPNLITLIGLTALVLSYVTGWALLPEFAGNAPRWFYFSCAFAVFFYLHMDCLDGKQARRTKNSSPLGQLFDHGCDALAVHLILMNVACSLNLPIGWRMMTGCYCVMVPWILAHWEEYHTGTMVYGNGYMGVTEANYAVVLVHLITGIIAPFRWLYHPFAALARSSLASQLLPPAAADFLATVQLNDFAVVWISSMAASLLVQQVVRVFRLSGSPVLEHTTLPIKERGHKQLGKWRAAWHLLQLLSFFVLGGVLVTLPGFAPGQGRVAFATFGVAYAMQATKFIMAHMSKEPFSMTAWPLMLMAFQIATHRNPCLDPVIVGYSVNAVVVLGYLHYVISMVNEICAYLKIPCLTVRKVVD